MERRSAAGDQLSQAEKFFLTLYLTNYTKSKMPNLRARRSDGFWFVVVDGVRDSPI